MAIIAERGLFVRLLIQSGKFGAPDAEALADALDAATRDPATKADLSEVKADLKSEIADVRKDVALLSQRIEALGDKLTVRMVGVGLALAGLLFTALRLTPP